MVPRALPALSGAICAVLIAACSTSAPPVETAVPTATTTPLASSTAVPFVTPAGTPLGGDRWDSSAIPVDREVGARFLFTCPTAGFNSFLWGTDTYTTGSSVCTAAVHAGLITFAAGGSVVIEIRPGQDSYVGSQRNGVTSSDQGAWDRSFVFFGAVPATSAPSGSPAAATPTSVVATPTAPLPSFSAPPSSSLSFCMSFNRSRFAERDENGQPFGVDVEISQALADRMSVEAQIVELPFDELIDAVVGSECDVTVSGHFITQARLELMDMVPYREGVPHVVVQMGNPLDIDELTDLCGRKFAAVSGTVYVDMVIGAGDYAGTGLDDQCATAGAPAVDLQEFTEQQAAEDALGEGEVDAYAGNDFVVIDRPNEFEWALELPRTRNGIGHRLALAELDGALREALRDIIDNGTYLEILSEYGVQEVALTIRP